MIARVATFDEFDPSAIDPEAVERLRSTIKATPGFVQAFTYGIRRPVRQSRSRCTKAGRAPGQRS
jgi:hypothetical protein